MANKILIDTGTLDQISRLFSGIQTEMNNLSGEIMSAQAEARRVASGQTEIINAIGKARTRSNAAASRARRLANAVQQSSTRWQEVERTLASKQNKSGDSPFSSGAKAGFTVRSLSELWKKIFGPDGNTQTKPGANEKVFDDKGKYGGNQSDAQYDKANHETFRKLIEKNTGRRLSDKELDQYLDGMASEGCGYMAMVNIIMKHYEGRPDAFEKTFGFPMYDSKTGDLNYNTLMVDLYSATDNHNKFLWWDHYSKYEDFDFGKDPLFGYDPYTDTDRSGTTAGEQRYRLELYLSDHGVDVDVSGKSDKKITVDNYASYAQKGDVIINTGDPLTMRDQNGRLVVNEKDAGHAMTVTGVETINIGGKPTKVFKVSSWGRVYYINPGDNHGYTNFNYVTFG